MAYEISQFDLASRQLLTNSARPAPKICTEIGNATVTQSIFGKARVRIICAHDRIRRVRMLSTLLAITIVGAIWQLTEHGDKLFGTPASEAVNATVQVTPPAFMPEYVAPTESASRKGNLRTPTEAEIYQLTTRPLPPPQPAGPPQSNLSLANPIAANPATVPASPQTANPVAPQQTTPQPRTTPLISTPTAPGTTPPAAAPPAAGNAAPRIPVAPQQPPKPAAVTQSATTATTAAVPPATGKTVAAPSVKATAPAQPLAVPAASVPASPQP